MTSSGDPRSGAAGVNEPDWIDQILERATEQVEAARPEGSLPIVPEATVPEPVSPESVSPESASIDPLVPEATVPEPVSSEPVIGDPLLAGRPSYPADELAEISWVDAPHVTPASTPIVPSDTELLPESLGRSAWNDELRNVGAEDPEGWDALSWEDMESKRVQDSAELREPTTYGRLIREWGPVLFAAVAIALFTRLVLVQAYHIPSGSMIPTLEEGDRVVVNRLSYRFGEIERGQLVVFDKPQGQEGENDLIKRVIGLPGETIQLRDNQVFVNGLRVEEPYLREQGSTGVRLTIPNCAQVDAAPDLCQIPQGYIFVMGDNRRGSSDSRVFGPVPADSVVGRAFLRVWPLNSIGQL